MKIDFFEMNDRILKSTSTKPYAVETNNLEKASSSFGQILKANIDHVAGLQNESKELVKGFMMGRVENIHDVTIAGEKAGLAMKTLNTMRKKVLEAYREISNTRL